MKQIEFINTDDLEFVAIISQNRYQYDNYNIAVYRKNDEYYAVFDLITETECFVMEKDDIEMGFSEFLNFRAAEWANNEDDSEIEMYRWFSNKIKSAKVADDYEGDCSIVSVGCFGGYSPIDWVRDENWDKIVFENYADAKAWIEDADDGIYHLSHNEFDRPDYTIVAA